MGTVLPADMEGADTEREEYDMETPLDAVRGF
jgi:hypothetical protein